MRTGWRKGKIETRTPGDEKKCLERFTRYRTNLERLDVEPGSCTQKKRIMKLEEKAETGETGWERNVWCYAE